jgi:hypothetical protein
MLRLLLNALAVVSFLLCVPLAVIWHISYEGSVVVGRFLGCSVLASRGELYFWSIARNDLIVRLGCGVFILLALALPVLRCAAFIDRRRRLEKAAERASVPN